MPRRNGRGLVGHSRLQLVALLVMALSCKDSPKELLIGNWAVDEIYINGQDVSYEVLSNILTFRSNGECGLPRMTTNQAVNGRWSIKKNHSDWVLSIQANDPRFQGDFSVVFTPDKARGVLVVALTNDASEIRASKLMHSLE